MNQLAFDWKARVRRTDPSTSMEAARASKDLSTAHYKLILEALKEPGTFYELADRSGLRPDQVWRRLGELERRGLALPLDETRPSPSGRACRVWKLL
jgi:DNA-binding MarR family transcriptional regulator